MRPLFYYVILVLCGAFIAMFFIFEHSKHVQIGYELTRLRTERHAVEKAGRELEFEISRSSSHDALDGAAKQLGLDLYPPSSARPKPN